jgi:hypothetical protein
MMLWRGWPHLGACTGERRPGMKRPASVFSVQGGEIVVDEKFRGQAQPVEASLKAEMRRGLVYSVAERGHRRG